MTDWNKRYMELAEYIAKWSKYPGRKVGAVIVNKRNILVSVGYNGNPRGCIDDDPSKYEKSVKYFYPEHAERNAIYNAEGRSLENCTMFVMWFPCADCARAIIQVGITTLVARRPNLDDPDWGDNFKAALKMLNEHPEITIIYYDEGEDPVKPEGWE